MPSAVVSEKNPAKVAAGQAGARARWGPPRTVRLDDLTDDQRRLVLALINAAKNEAPAPVEADAPEVDRHARDRTTARAS